MTAMYTDADFDELSWHDCSLHGIDLLTGDPDHDDWTSSVVLDIDFITRWACAVGGSVRFHVAPASLIFDGVTDLEIQIDWERSGHQTVVHPASINAIERERVVDQKIHHGRPYYSWTVSFNWPKEGMIRFGAVGFTMRLRSEPIETAEQSLSSARRGDKKSWYE